MASGTFVFKFVFETFRLEKTPSFSVQMSKRASPPVFSKPAHFIILLIFCFSVPRFGMIRLISKIIDESHHQTLFLEKRGIKEHEVKRGVPNGVVRPRSNAGGSRGYHELPFFNF